MIKIKTNIATRAAGSFASIAALAHAIRLYASRETDGLTFLFAAGGCALAALVFSCLPATRNENRVPSIVDPFSRS